jgi:hypothetical protein
MCAKISHFYHSLPLPHTLCCTDVKIATPRNKGEAMLRMQPVGLGHNVFIVSSKVPQHHLEK